MARWSRRRFLRAAGVAGASAPLWNLVGCGGERGLPPVVLVSASDDFSGRHHIAGLTLATGDRFDIDVPVRCHATALHPARPHVAVVARRPGASIFVVDVRDGSLIQTIDAPPQRHYLGHAVFDPTGDRLFATENVYDDAAIPDLTPRDSVIGVYDVAAGYVRIGELPAYGVGAHELAVIDDRTLVVAIGGLYTHPSREREDLNIDTMDPSLVAIDVDRGDLLAQHRLDDPQLSIRHIAVSAGGAIAVGMQYFGDPGARVPLVAWLRDRDRPLVPLAAPDAAWDALDHYIASVAVLGDGRTIAATSPPGGRIAFWDVDDGYLAAIDAADISGLAAVGDDFVATTGTGAVAVIDAADLQIRRQLQLDGVRWDNHVTAIPGERI